MAGSQSIGRPGLAQRAQSHNSEHRRQRAKPITPAVGIGDTEGDCWTRVKTHVAPMRSLSPDTIPRLPYRRLSGARLRYLVLKFPSPGADEFGTVLSSRRYSRV